MLKFARQTDISESVYLARRKRCPPLRQIAQETRNRVLGCRQPTCHPMAKIVIAFYSPLPCDRRELHFRRFVTIGRTSRRNDAINQADLLFLKYLLIIICYICKTATCIRWHYRDVIPLWSFLPTNYSFQNGFTFCSDVGLVGLFARSFNVDISKQ